MAYNTNSSVNQTEDKSKLLEYLMINISNNQEKIDALNRFKEQQPIRTIFRVPQVLHEMNGGAYSPSVVAIGPLHRGKKHLQPMEAVKLSYMHNLFCRTPNFNQTHDDCMVAMLKMEPTARRCYADDLDLDDIQDVNSSSSDQNAMMFAKNVRFAEMMLIDGCFIIEFFHRRCCTHEWDHIKANHAIAPALEKDLVLLENQIPFDVLDQLFRLTIELIPENTNRSTLTECILNFYWDVIGIEGSKLKTRYDKRPHHLLHLLHSCYWPQPQEEKERDSREDMDHVVLMNFRYSATELDYFGGIKLVQGNKKDIFDITFMSKHIWFWRRSEFLIPPFLVQDSTEVFLRNFIALEQSTDDVKSYFTSHAFIIHKLINANEDVLLLEKQGILVNCLGCPEDVANLFNNLCKNLIITRFHGLAEPCVEVIKFQTQTKFLIKLRRDYFSNPWTVISVFSASILFLLTLLQTIYTMRS